jgi:hypothetical protein
LLLGHTVYELCSFRLKDSSVTSVTVQRAFLGGGGIPPRRIGDGGARCRSRRRGRNSVPRCNEPSRTNCGALRPSYKARHRAGSTTTHRKKYPSAPHGGRGWDWDLRLGPTVYELYSFRLKNSSVTSVTVQSLLSWAAVYHPVGSGTAGHDAEAAPEGGKMSRGATNILGLTAGFCGLPTRQGIGPDQLPRTDREKYHARRGNDQIPRTEGNSRSRQTGAAKAAGAFRLGPTVYKVWSFRLKDISVTSVTVQSAFIGGGVIQPRRIGDGGAQHRSRPRGRNTVPRRKELSRTDCAAPHPSTGQGVGPDQLPHTDREMYHALRGKRPTTRHRRK